MNMNVQDSMEAARIAIRAIGDKKGSDIVAFDVSELSSLTDYVVIASGLNAPHLKAMAQEVLFQLKKEGRHCHNKSGDPDSGWIIVDYMNIMIHLFSRTQREYYALDDLLKAAPQLEI